MSDYDLEMNMKVYDNNSSGGAALTVRPFPDAPNSALHIRTVDDIDKKWFGDVEIIMSMEGARKLALALNAVADHIEKQNDR